MKTLTRVTALFAASLAGVVSAADYPAPIEALRERGVEIVDTFTAPSQLQGYAALYQGRPLAIYLTADKQHALIGNLIDAQAEDLTAPILEEKVSRPQSEALWKTLESETHWVAEGSAQAPTIVYVFTDPNCPYCKRLWENVQPWVKAGKVQIRHIPVGVLGESSRKKAAFILASKDPVKALIDNESGKRAAKENSIAEAQAQQLDTNMSFMQRLGASGTPAILYRDATGLLQLYPGAAQGEDLVEIFGSKP